MQEALREMGDDMFSVGIIDAAAHAKITLRDVSDAQNVEEIAPVEIKALRERHHLSQGALGHYINVSTGYVSQMERGVRRPTGSALVLLNVIRRKGLEAIL
jgi:putative transcriptional regulator